MHTKTMMQLSCVKLVDLRRGEHAILDRIDLPADDARRLMELGFLPGTQVTAGWSAPGGDPQSLPGGWLRDCACVRKPRHI